MKHKNSQFVDADVIGFEEVGDEWVSVNMGSEKFVMDLDTLIELTFRCTAFLSFLENKEEIALQSLDAQCECASTKMNLH